MHPTLSPFGNAVLGALWGILAAVLAVISPEAALVAIAIGALGGLVAGLLQARALSAEPSRFAAAGSAIEVRKALLATTAGKRAIVLQWLTAATLIVVVFLISPKQLLIGAFAGQAAFMCTREFAALRAVVRLSRIAVL